MNQTPEQPNRSALKEILQLDTDALETKLESMSDVDVQILHTEFHEFAYQIVGETGTEMDKAAADRIASEYGFNNHVELLSKMEKVILALQERMSPEQRERLLTMTNQRIKE